MPSDFWWQRNYINAGIISYILIVPSMTVCLWHVFAINFVQLSPIKVPEHPRPHSLWMHIVRSRRKIFKFAFQYFADNICKNTFHNFSYQISVIWHCFSVFGKKTYFTFWVQFLKAMPDFILVFTNAFFLGEPQNRLSIFQSLQGIWKASHMTLPLNSCLEWLNSVPRHQSLAWRHDR